MGADEKSTYYLTKYFFPYRYNSFCNPPPPHYWYGRVACAVRSNLGYHCYHTCSFFFLLSFRRPYSAASYSKLKGRKVVGISLSDRKKLSKTIGVSPGTLYTPHLALIWG